jgi:hypothetical protein
MKKILLSFVIIFALIFTQGCIEVKTTIKLNKDGSGTVEETVLMSSEIVNMLRDFIEGFSELNDDSVKTEQEEFKLYNEENLKNRVKDFGEGSRFVSGKEIKEDGKEGYTAVYSFDNISNLRIDQNPNSRMPDALSSDSEGDEYKEFLTFSFNEGNPSELIINMPPASFEPDEFKEDEETEEESGEMSLEELEESKQFIKDMRISLNLVLDGKITESNATYLSGSEVLLLDINFNELLNNPEKLEVLRKTNPDNMQQLKDIIRDIPGIKIETNDPVKIKFQ